jgi:centromeric protein E
VAVRVRPLNAKESSNSRVAWRVVKGQPRIELAAVDGGTTTSDLPKSARDQYDFDKTFGEDATTKDVYDGSVLNIVKSVCAGLNGTVFAYGQTSSGKTFTMQGSGTIQQGSDGNTSPGIIHMAADDIFGHIESQPNRLFVVTASFLEVYNEDVRDLLSDDTGSSKSLPVREDKRGRGFFVNCKEEPVTGKESLLSILARGEKTRSFAATAMNERSSRSHTIMRLTIESRSKPSESDDGAEADEEAVIASTLTLVDLAGSESVRHTGATGDRQTEGANINKRYAYILRF